MDLYVFLPVSSKLILPAKVFTSMSWKAARTASHSREPPDYHCPSSCVLGRVEQLLARCLHRAVAVEVHVQGLRHTGDVDHDHRTTLVPNHGSAACVRVRASLRLLLLAAGWSRAQVERPRQAYASIHPLKIWITALRKGQRRASIPGHLLGKGRLLSHPRIQVNPHQMGRDRASPAFRPGVGEMRERELRKLVLRGGKPVALFIDEVHDLHGRTLNGLKRLMEVIARGDGSLSVVLIGDPKLRNDLRCPTMEEIGHSTDVLSFEGLGEDARAYLDWLFGECTEAGVDIDTLIEPAALGLMALRLATPLQFAEHLNRAFEAGFRTGQKPVTAQIAAMTLAPDFDDIEPRVTRQGYPVKVLAESSMPSRAKSAVSLAASSTSDARGSWRTGCAPSGRPCDARRCFSQLWFRSQSGEPVSDNLRSFSDNVSRQVVSFSNNVSRNWRCSQGRRRMFSSQYS